MYEACELSALLMRVRIEGSHLVVPVYTRQDLSRRSLFW